MDMIWQRMAEASSLTSLGAIVGVGTVAMLTAETTPYYVGLVLAVLLAAAGIIRKEGKR